MVEEEQVYESAPSKLDYYKNGIRCVKRVFDKSIEIKAKSVAPMESLPSTDKVEVLETTATTDENGNEILVKRAKTRH